MSELMTKGRDNLNDCVQVYMREFKRTIKNNKKQQFEIQITIMFPTMFLN